MSARVAIYYAPLPNDPLTQRSATWLGRDAGSPQPDLPKIAEITAEPRLYGFHATLKPPMRLREGTSDAFAATVRALAADLAPFDLPPLAVADLHGFLALRETTPCPPLQALADSCVERLDAFRAPPTDDELARRRKANLSPEQDAMLLRWGYPYVFSTWFFHMTLTRRLSPAEKTLYRPAAESWFVPVLSIPRRIHDICLFHQPAPGQPFTLAERFPLGAQR